MDTDLAENYYRHKDMMIDSFDEGRALMRKQIKIKEMGIKVKKNYDRAKLSDVTFKSDPMWLGLRKAFLG